MHDLEDLRLQHGARRTRTRAGAASLPSSSSSVSWEGQGEGRARLLQKSFGLDDKILPRIILTSGAVSDCTTARTYCPCKTATLTRLRGGGGYGGARP